MKALPEVTEQEVLQRARELAGLAERGAYHLHPDSEMTGALVRGLLINEKRYGYPACPCRCASGRREDDIDIICPCFYRDADLAEYGACYCALYVSAEIAGGSRSAEPIPERRPSPAERAAKKAAEHADVFSGSPVPVLRCRVCGYLCARPSPPEHCPICHATADRFERFA
ncbi:MAG: ferredoxin:glutaredoxin reductase [Methanomicrobiales archaeon]|nr:ferredoxin:glutaredoxin reductase [Methanomicrobiales archaeon]